ncbi:accessory Sec system protein translocase subunit SecY2 [Streptococcus pseudoporcinus]|uniref:Accessory Sec system protein translocase subunit SecY2 n=1 Tax=Streptococcus pseudoporcinus LQ 940-04 TaxID=875093 RepID=G5K934_9STRE|nr:accessory Sec system protein translocase subunit SecY2 [Streptococcus pseudoporcinus]EFR44433.1 accessory Sec system translocase SecY2 [Streptococcus pseudoporcinus SPIN 20026]EHI65513.1 accessory Sec system translocase SecY2 [Streptococcus pseudoporcinus LQ 940-04]VEF93509.1 preprotein translocase subunit SecY [Streptococcus pseudoporcinus]
MQANRQMVKSPLKKKAIASLLIILVYLIGRHIPLPLVDVDASAFGGLNGDLMTIASLVSGGDFSQVSLFTLGLGPWMSTMILWGFLSTSKKLNVQKMSLVVADRWRKTIMIIISVIQSLGLLSFMAFQTWLLPFDRLGFLIIVAFLSIAGCFVIMWLAHLNMIFGLGSSSLLILVGLISSMPARLSQAFAKDSHFNAHIWVYGLILTFAMIALVVTIFLERAEYRIPLERVMIHNDFVHKSYIPIKMNVAGGMAIMYGMTLLVLPQYLLSGLQMIAPHNQTIAYVISNLTLSKSFGLTVYLIILFLLTVGFALVNVKPDKVTEGLQEMGDYIHGVKPGHPTFTFLNRLVKQVGFLGGAYTCFIIGFPLVLGHYYKIDTTISTFPGTILILATLLFAIFDQVEMLQLNKQYRSIL